MNKETTKTLSQEECMEKLKTIGQYASGTSEDIEIKLKRLCLYPKNKKATLSKRSHSFKCSLELTDTPPLTAK